MVFTQSDKDFIKNVFLQKGYRGKRIVKEFPGFGWSVRSVNHLIHTFEERGYVERKRGCGRPITACTQENIDYTEEMIQSQEDRPGTHLAPRELTQHLSVSQSSVRRMISKSKLKSYKRVLTSRKSDGVKEKRITRSRALLRRFDNDTAKNIVFTDEKDFTLEPAMNTKNDVVYGKKGA